MPIKHKFQAVAGESTIKASYWNDEHTITPTGGTIDFNQNILDKCNHIFPYANGVVNLGNMLYNWNYVFTKNIHMPSTGTLRIGNVLMYQGENYVLEINSTISCPYIYKINTNTIQIQDTQILGPERTLDNVDVPSSLLVGRVTFDNLPTGAPGRVLKAFGTGVSPAYSSLDWTEIANKPSEYPPESHTHPRSDISDFWDSPFWNNIPDKPSEYPPESHNHSAADITSGILSTDRGGLGKALSPTWNNDYILVYKTSSDSFVMEAKPTGGTGGGTVTIYKDEFSLVSVGGGYSTISSLTISLDSTRAVLINAGIEFKLLGPGYVGQIAIVIDGNVNNYTRRTTYFTNQYEDLQTSTATSLSAGSHTIALRFYAGYNGTVTWGNLVVLVF